jgi:guanylate kinase
MSSKKAIIFSAPSGAGKTTIVQHLLQQDLPLEFSVSACSRKPRGQEKEAHDYYFLSPEAFKSKVQEGAFMEWEEVYANMFYGTLNAELERIWNNDMQVVFDVDVVGGINLKDKFKDRALSIFIAPPSLKVLEQRLTDRGTDNSSDIAKRLAKAQEELAKQDQFDVIVSNDNLEVACQEVLKQVSDFLKK